MVRPLHLFAVASFLWLLACDSGGTNATPGGTSGSGGAAGSGGSSPDTSLQALADCKAACEIADALKCFQSTPGDCAKLCDSAAKAKSCAESFATYSACAKGAEWKCESGVPAVPDCATSQTELAQCLAAKGNGNGTIGEPSNFFCDKTVCDGSETERACCLKIDVATFSVQSKCVAAIAECGQDSRWECDGPDDCGGRPCCWSNPSTGMGQIIVGVCRDSCNQLGGEREVCQDKCTTGICCPKKDPTDKGPSNCEQSQEICDAKAMEQPQN